jgi:MFS family permease
MGIDPELKSSFKHNFIVNILDGGFFGFGLGFASFVTVIPLFISSLTNSAILIGLISAIHSVGWQLPQLFTARHVSRQARYKPYVILLTINERVPFLGLAIIALFSPLIGIQTTLVLTFLMIVWQGFGGGFTANAWQSMVGKIMPADRLGTFFGAQSSLMAMLASIGAIFAGFILQKYASPNDFSLNFLFAFLAMTISWFFLAWTREPSRAPVQLHQSTSDFWKSVAEILRVDTNFVWFLVVRILSQLAVMGFAFYSVYAVRHLGMTDISVGVLTSILLAIQVIASPIMGWLGDHWSHRKIMAVGILAGAASGFIAWKAPSATWLYPVVLLAGITNVATWTIGMAFIQEFGEERQRPIYIGLANTLIAPMTILAPILGGWLADDFGYPITFLVSGLIGIATTIILLVFVKDPVQVKLKIPDVTTTLVEFE